MKKIFSLTSTMAIVVICCFSCKKSVTETAKNEYSCVKGKLLRENCVGAAIQILTPDLNIGDITWEDRQGSLSNPIVAVYYNVINGANICTIREDIANKNIVIGDTLYFDLRIVESSYFDNGCIICDGFESDMPDQKAMVYNISKNGCFMRY